MSNLNFHQMFEIRRQNDFKSVKKFAWIVFISFLLSICFYFLPIVLDFIYDLKLYNFDSIANILTIIFCVIFLISYSIMILKLYFTSKSKVLLISFFIAASTQFIALFNLIFIMSAYPLSQTRIALYSFSFLCLIVAIFCTFIFFKTLRALCKNQIYFLLCFIFKSMILIIVFIFMLFLIHSKPSLALAITLFMFFFFTGLLFVIYYALFAFALSKNQNIKFIPNLKLLSNEKENI
ncbi:TPA_asm: hypothetical protein GD804_05640 [Campylobacter jejuni]|uniref:hypothetical protein n=1 Tax=Campylobacter jejuni TaxID=197 RepID=UPI0008738F51|nr:hypothetical protein [Campylobacter jejuni]EJA4380435.1 hypothetical protein [Campylobacter jejuni]MBX1056212.1 hypothetical protein [Campylobacter jejuni]OEY29974.1 hypothetical protein A0L14_04150 [Campylobacter jejuni]OEY50525.1 hypothetical protein A0L25_01125 [Campylobacter jejuni]OKY07234.1 hypothetical protein A0L35_08025 [Campylobacter jejuni]